MLISISRRCAGRPPRAVGHESGYNSALLNSSLPLFPRRCPCLKLIPKAGTKHSRMVCIIQWRVASAQHTLTHENRYKARPRRQHANTGTDSPSNSSAHARAHKHTRTNTRVHIRTITRTKGCAHACTHFSMRVFARAFSSDCLSGNRKN